MGLFRKKKKTPEISRAQALACRPVRSDQVRSEEMEGGKVLLTFPLNLKPLFTGIARRFGLWKDNVPMSKRIELDEMGALVWSQINGRNTVKAIVAEVAKRYNLGKREAEVSTTLFLKELGKRGIIWLEGADGMPPSGGA